MKITVIKPNNENNKENSLTFNEADFAEFLNLFHICKKEKYTMVIELVDDWD